MALEGFCLCHSLFWNFFFLNPMEDELARDSGLIRDPNPDSTSPAPSRNPTLGPKLVPALIPAPVPALAPSSSDELFKQFMKAYLESNQGPKQPPAERKQSFKAKVPDMYYKKSYMDCYHFYQQCKDHFKTAGTTGANQTPFAAFFLCGSINVRYEELTPITWTEFKAFLQKNLGESKLFVNSIWRKLKRDSQY